MKQWPYKELAGYDVATVRKHCVEHHAWQQVRLSMKGVSTEKKLDILHEWRENCALNNFGEVPFSCQVQIVNYLGALRRGGQLDMQNRVQR